MADEAVKWLASWVLEQENGLPVLADELERSRRLARTEMSLCLRSEKPRGLTPHSLVPICEHEKLLFSSDARV
jgi:hypothetical protein